MCPECQLNETEEHDSSKGRIWGSLRKFYFKSRSEERKFFTFFLKTLFSVATETFQITLVSNKFSTLEEKHFRRTRKQITDNFSAAFVLLSLCLPGAQFSAEQSENTSNISKAAGMCNNVVYDKQQRE